MAVNKPLLSTSEPAFMGSLGDVFHMHLAGEKTVFDPGEDKRVVPYFDGQLQDLMGYDVPYLLSGDVTGEDHQECRVITPDGEFFDGFINVQVDDYDMNRVLLYIQDHK